MTCTVHHKNVTFNCYQTLSSIDFTSYTCMEMYQNYVSSLTLDLLDGLPIKLHHHWTLLLKVKKDKLHVQCKQMFLFPILILTSERVFNSAYPQYRAQPRKCVNYPLFLALVSTLAIPVTRIGSCNVRTSIRSTKSECAHV